MPLPPTKPESVEVEHMCGASILDVRLTTRQHIDLLRTAGALCRP
ncbi:putative leader peptide [Streptomyces sp. YS-B37]